ncbi:MAG: aminomethyl-transferring glycine dehydrogenase subunit GcvPB, partial [Acidobacteria bacterium]
MKTLREKEKTLFERGGKGKMGVDLPKPEGLAPAAISGPCLRSSVPKLPDLSEVEVVRHFTRLSKLNYGVDDGFYPLGSCTMKHNPKINEVVASLDGFKWSHPMLPYGMVQGSLKAMKMLENVLNEITGMDGCSLQPAAGAHGELTGVMMIRAYQEKKGNPRSIMLIPDSAHGTNPASSAFSGYQVKEVASDESGSVDLNALAEVLDENVAGMMLTNPNTLGIFEKNIRKIADMLHEKGALLYMDGANMNAMMGKARPGELGVDVMHLNLHKTFSTPHGGGGPGAGPVCFMEHMAPFQPTPVVNGTDGDYKLDWNRPDSIGKIHGFYGNFLVTLKALAYILSLGGKGLEQSTEDAVLAAN